MNLNAYKMNGLGNDFVILDNRDNSINLSKDQIIKISDRKFIGCDQLIIINQSKEYDSELIFYNSDGSMIGACGNGTRCVAYFLSKEKEKNNILLKTGSGILNSKITNRENVETEMGKAKFYWKEIPLTKELDTKNLNIKILDKLNRELIGGIAINIGNPHLIFFLENIDSYDLAKIGPKLEKHEYFPERCNVTFAKIINKQTIQVKVWERGVGLTKACGTAACATAVAAQKVSLSDRRVNIKFSQGYLSVFIDKNNLIRMNGPVSNIEKIKISI